MFSSVSKEERLCEASSKGDVKTVRRLLREGADPNHRSKNYTHCAPLHIASEKGNVQVVEALLDSGVNVDVRTAKFQMTSLHIAAGEGHTDVANLLLERGADVLARDVDSRTPWACVCQNAKLSHILAAAETKKRALALKAQGNQLFRAGQYTQAIAKYEKAIAFDASAPSYWSNLAACYEKMGQYEKMADSARACIKADESFIKGYYRLAVAQEAMNDLTNCMKTLESGLIIQSDNPTLNQMKEEVQELILGDTQKDSKKEPSEPSAFFRHLLQEHQNIKTISSLVTFAEELLQKINDVHELKLYCSLIMTTSRQGGPLEWQDSRDYIQRALEAATSFCHDKNSIATYKTVLEYYEAQGILDRRTMHILDNEAEVFRMEHADFIVDMRDAIQQNTQRIQGLEGTVENLQKNLEILDHNVRNIQNKLKGFKEGMRRKHQIQRGIGILCAVLDAATFGIGGGLVEVIDCVFGGIVDFGDTAHVLAIVQSQNCTEATELFQKGTELVRTHLQNMGEAYADSQLEKEIQKEPSPLLVLGVVCAMNDASIVAPKAASESEPQQEPQPTQTPTGQSKGGGMLARVQALESACGVTADNNVGLLQRVAQLETTIGVSGEGMALLNRITQLEQLCWSHED